MKIKIINILKYMFGSVYLLMIVILSLRFFGVLPNIFDKNQDVFLNVYYEIWWIVGFAAMFIAKWRSGREKSKKPGDGDSPSNSKADEVLEIPTKVEIAISKEVNELHFSKYQRRI